jgi:histidine triad (HIT) family protein
MASDCLFCQIAAGQGGSGVVLRTQDCLAFLDHRPLFPGHVLLIPKEHIETLGDLPPNLVEPLFAAAQVLAKAMEQALGAEGSFVAVNNRISQSVPHLHVHVVPRRKGDGLRGFFWPRGKYKEGEMEAVRSKLEEAVLRLQKT